MRVLLAAPFVGEIGWELLSWQARVRKVFRDGGFERLVVLGAAGRTAFYADMPLTYRVVDLSGLPGTAYEDRRLAEHPRRPVAAEVIRERLAGVVAEAAGEQRANGATVEVLWPAYAGRLWPCDAAHQAFIRFERRPGEPLAAPWVALVRRTRRFREADNWPAEHWTELRELLARQGIRADFYPDQAEAAIELLTGCDLAVGQSTGGLHLAALCGCPAVVWAQPDGYRASPWQMTDRQRYQTLWNPLGTAVDFHGLVRQPGPREVAEWVRRALARIGRRTGSRLAGLAFRCRWRTRGFIDRAVVRRPSFQHWPWAVQRFVRYSLV
ncbi:MAG: hypothetical protein HRF43_16945 [Phycisphaerae bacterium]|jgi:hypothetical protein